MEREDGEQEGDDEVVKRGSIGFHLEKVRGPRSSQAKLSRERAPLQIFDHLAAAFVDTPDANTKQHHTEQLFEEE